MGIQFFLAAHSYYTIRKLYLVAQTKNISISCLNILNDDYIISDFFNDEPMNKIMDAFIELYDQEINL